LGEAVRTLKAELVPELELAVRQAKISQADAARQNALLLELYRYVREMEGNLAAEREKDKRDRDAAKAKSYVPRLGATD
jgi:hypothetical protein